MKVQEMMCRNVSFCSPDMNLAEVTALMWQNDCCVLPLMDGGRLAGIITDRDVCIALGTRNLAAGSITAAEVATVEVFTCAPSDDVHQALKTMRTHKVRRLPVLNGNGGLVGILSLNEVILRAHKTARKPGDVTYEDVVNTLKAICEHRAGAAEAPSAAVEEKAMAAAAG